MDEDVKTLADYLDAIRRRRAVLLGVATLVFIASALVAFLLPAVYRSSSTILIEQQEIPEELVRSTVTSYADQRLQVISQRVMTTSNLLEIIDKYDLYAEEREDTPTEVVVDQMRQDIALETVSAEVVDPRTGKPTQATIAFTLAFESEVPRLAQVVANELTSLYLSENVKTRTQLAEDTTSFLADEAARLERQVAQLEGRLAEFKERNVNRLPELKQLNLQLMDRTERELAEVDREIQAVEERKIYLQSQLAQINPFDRIISETGERILGPADRLKAAQAQYVSLAASYAEQHPDVVKLRKEIEALEREVGIGAGMADIQARLEGARGELAMARERYAPEHPDVKRLERQVAALEGQVATAAERAASPERPAEATNPAYIQLQAQMDAALSEQRALRQKRATLEDKLLEFERRLVETPQVEREYLNLGRELENALAKYRETKAKQMESEISRSLEAERKGERFTLIEPPLLPEEPVKPNRLAILFLGFVFALAGGFGTVAVLEALDQTVRGGRGVAALVKSPPLAVIPFIETPGDRRRRVLRRVVAGVSFLVGLVAVLLVVHLLVRPLDVAWFILLRKLGI